MASENRVVVTGVGTVAPGCRDTAGFWSRLLRGESAIRPLATGAAAGMGDRLGGEVELIRKESLGISRKELRYLDVVSTYGLIAAQEAVAAAGLDGDGALPREEIGFAIGLFSGPLSLSRHESNVNLFSAAMSAYYGSVIGNITIPLKICGPSSALLNLDLAGADAIGYGYRLVRHGKARAVLAGGSDSGFNAYLLSQLHGAGFLANGAGGPPRGMVLGEGAALVLLESLESAEGRGREIYAEVLGYHAGSGEAAAAAIGATLAGAGVDRDEVDCVLASSTGLPELDAREADALRAVFGDGGRPARTGITWAVGNTLGAAGALQAVAAALILKEQAMPAAAAGGECPAAAPVDVLLQNGFGLSGRSSFLVLGRYGRRRADG